MVPDADCKAGSRAMGKSNVASRDMGPYQWDGGMHDACNCPSHEKRVDGPGLEGKRQLLRKLRSKIWKLSSQCMTNVGQRHRALTEDLHICIPAGERIEMLALIVLRVAQRTP